MADLLEAFDRAARWIDAYYRDPDRYPVLSRSKPGDLVRALPTHAPDDGEPFDTIFGDFETLVMPGITHWNHPRFFAYFSISATPVAVIAEALAAALDVNAMLWRTSPAATELEDVVVGWLRELLGLDAGLHGIVYDTASTSGFTALAAARESLGLDVRERGLAGRSDLPTLRVYITDHTHSHVEKAAIALGVGRANVVRVAVDATYAMRPDALEAALRDDLARGMRPMCVAATVGTTSTTASDPVPAIATIAARYGVWLHVDAAYAGPAAILPECAHLLAGCERADSVVVNPHKWLFVPIDLSVLFVRDLPLLRRTFRLVADYLVTPDDARDYMDYGLQLGRRFRALKLWFAMRHLGVRGMRDLIRGHIALAQTFARWVRAESDWEVVAPHPLSVVCFRHRNAGAADGDACDARNLAIVDAVNASGDAYLSTTKLDGRVAIRLAIGNERTTEADVARAWTLLRSAAIQTATGTSGRGRS
ncbi:MAG: aspartate aminotransferase family protein [Vulcanimicrobiaceae bacterium]